MKVHSLAAILLVFGIAASALSDHSENHGPASRDLKSIQEQILQQLPKVGPTVVSIQANGGSGSGVIVSADGLILTAAHVIDKASDLTVIYPDGRRFRGKALGTYGPSDAAMAQIIEGAPHPYAEVAPADSPAIGQTIFAMGHPGGFDLDRGAPIRIGHIKEITGNFFSTDAPLIGGDSGGPSFDLLGRVIGIHSHIGDEVDINRDGHIAAFHHAWDSMKQGIHDQEHFSTAVENQSNQAAAKGPAAGAAQMQPQTSANARNLADRLKELTEKSKANDGKLSMDREELLKLRQQIVEQTDSLGPASGSRIQDDWSAAWNAALAPHCRDLSKSVLKVIVGGRHAALATVVSSDGYLVTKASEVKNRQIQVQLATTDQSASPTLLAATIEAIDDALDLALIKIQALDSDHDERLLAIDWNKSIEPLPKGSLCAAIGAEEQPVGFGIISVPIRSLEGKSGAFLGVGVEPEKTGLVVREISPRSPALKSGLQAGDIILSVEAVKLQTAEDLSALIASMTPGDGVRLDVQRDDTQFTLTVKLVDGAQLAPMPGSQEQAVDSISAKLSRRRWRFRCGYQHDCSIAANNCGGPLVDLDGRLIGINIARSGRIQSFAIPILEVKQFVETSIAQGTVR